MDISVGDRVEMKKQHPCGCKTFEILRVGMDFKIKCEKCGKIGRASVGKECLE